MDPSLIGFSSSYISDDITAVQHNWEIKETLVSERFAKVSVMISIV